jgi:hypothetical protein
MQKPIHKHKLLESQIASTKLQIETFFLKIIFAFGILVIVIYLEFGICVLEFPVYPG